MASHNFHKFPNAFFTSFPCFESLKLRHNQQPFINNNKTSVYANVRIIWKNFNQQFRVKCTPCVRYKAMKLENNKALANFKGINQSKVLINRRCWLKSKVFQVHLEVLLCQTLGHTLSLSFCKAKVMFPGIELTFQWIKCIVQLAFKINNTKSNEHLVNLIVVFATVDWLEGNNLV